MPNPAHSYRIHGHSRSTTHDHSEPRQHADEPLSKGSEIAVGQDLINEVNPLAVLDCLPTAVYGTDSAGRITFFNDAAADLWGRRPVLGEDLWCGSWRLFSPDGSPMAHDECPMARALKSGEPINGEEALLERPDGRRIAFLAYPNPSKDPSGKIVGAINTLLDITDRKASEEALLQRDEELTDFVENTTIGLHRVAGDGTILWANRAEMDLLGVSPDEYIGRHIAEFHADAEVIEDILNRLARFEILRDYEARLRCKDGSIKHVLIDSGVYKKDGQFGHTRCFTRDITAQKMMETRLAVTAAVSQILSASSSLDEAAPLVLEALGEHFDADVVELWLGDPELRCAAFYSRLPESALGRYRAVTETLSFALNEGLQGRVRSTQEPMWMEQVASNQSFMRRDLAADIGINTAVCFPIPFGQSCLGVVTCMMRRTLTSDSSLLSMMHTIGSIIGEFIERTRGEEFNRHLASIVEASPDAIINANLDEKITGWNKGAEELFGYCAEEAIGKSVSLIIPEDATPQRRLVVEALKSGKNVKSLESIRCNKAGKIIPVSISWSSVRDSSGRLIAIPAIIRDISPRIAIEAQLDARARQLAAVAELGMNALLGDDFQGLLDQCASQLAIGLDVELTKVLELQSNGDDLLLRAGVGWKEGLVGRATVPNGFGSHAGYTLSVDQPVIVEDFGAETRFSASKLLLDHGVVSGLSVIVRGDENRPFGVLSAHSKGSRTFSPDDLQFLLSIANVLTVALQRKAYGDRQSTLVSELSHRVKNTLAVVSAMASQTSQYSGSVDEFLRGFKGRLHALSQAHNVLTESNWGGTSLKVLVKFVLTSQVHETRLRFDLKDLVLSANGTQILTMIIHELITNALKYGSLSTEHGTINISGHRLEQGDDRAYRIVWQEDGGPPVNEPARTGFGSKLITMTVEDQCGGEAVMNWRRNGLCATITIPEASIVHRHHEPRGS